MRDYLDFHCVSEYYTDCSFAYSIAYSTWLLKQKLGCECALIESQVINPGLAVVGYSWFGIISYIYWYGLGGSCLISLRFSDYFSRFDICVQVRYSWLSCLDHA